MRSKIFLFFLFSMFIVSFASAIPYQQGNSINLTVSCDFINCSDGDIDLTVVDPNGYVIIGSEVMTKLTGYVSYSLNSTQTSQVGTHQAFISSDNDTYSLSFEITPNGEIPTTAKAVFYVGMLFILMIFLVLMLYGFAEADQIWGRVAFLSMTYLLLIAISFISWNMSASFLTSAPFLISFLRIIFLTLMIAFFPFLLGLFAYGIWMMFQVEEIKKLQDQGFTPEEASEKVKKRRMNL